VDQEIPATLATSDRGRHGRDAKNLRASPSTAVRPTTRRSSATACGCASGIRNRVLFFDARGVKGERRLQNVTGRTLGPADAGP
jgi:hypothetical protein